uniref:Integrase_H2C2 domain-containing protein n=1 Tax=Onchocerca volvulus TaxID=6282 RepID=A0A8R1XR24_ONCVO
MVHPLERWPNEEFGEVVQEGICMALGLTTCTEISCAKRTIIVDVKRFSSLQKLIRTILFVMRFMAKVSGGKCKTLTDFTKRGSFTSSDYVQAKKLVVRIAQSEVSQEDLEKWGLVRDADDLWKFLGRLRWPRSKLTNFSYSICKGRIAEMIVKHYHEKMFHASANLTWVKVRQTYWIPHGKTYVKSILRKLCKGCTRWNVIQFEQPEFPPSSPERMTVNRPFEKIGVDLFGPIWVKNRTISKRWVALFTCLVTRAIHMEVMKNMSAEAFMQTFRGFVSRRRRPDFVLSDNAKNFVLASKLIQENSSLPSE